MAKCCNTKLFKDKKYFFSEKMVYDGCVLFRADHEEELEKIFMERNKTISATDFIEQVCGDQMTKACNKVDPDSLKKPVFYLDGVAQDDSMVTMGWGIPPEQD